MAVRLVRSMSRAAAAATTRRPAPVPVPGAAAASSAATAAAAAPHPQGSRIVLESPFGGLTVPDEILPAFLERKNGHLIHNPCLTCGATGRSLSFGQAREASRRWAWTLIGRLGLRPGDVIAVLLPNVPEFLPAVQGALLAGIRVTFANPIYTALELKRQFDDADARLVVTVAPLAATAREAAPKASVVIVGDDSARDDGAFLWQDLLDGATEVPLPKPHPSDVAALPYSSGTTGLPKGVELTHRNLVANLHIFEHPSLSHIKPTTDTFQEVVLTPLPFFHIYGFNGNLNIGAGWGVHTVSLPRFTPDLYLECLEQYKPTILMVVPALLQFLVAHPAVTTDTLKPLNAVVSGAAPATRALIDKFREKVGRDDLVFRQGYGMTESSPVTLMVPTVAPRSKEVSVGQLMPGTEARVVRENGADARPHETGELLVRGPQIMRGYLNNEKATKETVDEEGWLHTGDVVYYDEDHYFYVVDRTKELIKVKGNQVSPTELENLIMEIPEVSDCAVVGIPDDLAGEIPRAFVVLHPNKKLTEEQVRQYVEPKVVKYKKLAGGVIFIDAIPRNTTGKIMRPALKKWPEKN